MLNQVSGSVRHVWLSTNTQQGDKSETARPWRLVGTHPLNWFLLTNSLVKLTRSPSSGGIAPTNWLMLRDITRKLMRLPNSGGIFPVSWL